MPHYAEGLLANGEHLILIRRQHWFTLVDMAKWAILGIVVAIILLILSSGLAQDGFSGTLRSLISIAVIVLLVASFARLVWGYLRWSNDEFVLTNRRVMQVEGILNKRTTDSSLEKINDAVLSQSVVGRMFGFGDLDILTASESGIDRMRMLIDATGFKKAMIESKHDLEIELARGPAVSPPLRSQGEAVRETIVETAPPPPRPPVTPPPAVSTDTDRVAVSSPADAPAAEPSGGSAASARAADAVMPSATHLTADDVERTLAQLASLRDRGVITADEYESRRTELLGRL